MKKHPSGKGSYFKYMTSVTDNHDIKISVKKVAYMCRTSQSSMYNLLKEQKYMGGFKETHRNQRKKIITTLMSWLKQPLEGKNV
jgi:L-lactate utilization protein LutB